MTQNTTQSKRVIKFRAWDKENKNMFLPGSALQIIDSIDDGEINFSDRFEIMQFTDMLDYNDNEIYEGDILEFEEHEWGDPNNKNIVKYENGDWVGIGIKEDWHAWCKVIGNIYENPELLK